jgi:peptide/nickel transport system permease protein
MLRRFMSFRILFGGSLLLVFVFCAAFAPMLAPYPPGDMDLLSPLLPPIWAQDESMFSTVPHLLGTDSLGKDVLSNLIYGSRVSLYVAVTAGTLTMLVGGALGLIAGYAGGLLDKIVVRLTDLWMCFPPIVLAMILMVGLGAGTNNIVLAIVLVDWTRFCKVVRAETLVASQRDYIAAARLLGYTPLRVVLSQVLPATIHIIVTMLTLEMGIAVIVEVLLSFAGMGVEPDVPAWGQMIADARTYMYQNIWSMLLPVGAVFLTVLSFNVLGDGLRLALDPRTLGQNHDD